MAESTPGDYYKRQYQKAQEIQARIVAVQSKLDRCDCAECRDNREILRGLNVELSMARYTGD